jgi:O-antigen/teichoic acid export membrane protein
MENEKEEITKKASGSIKWTTLSCIFSKLIAPLTNMILSRFLAPSIFGIIASISIITAFADILSEGGFARYILQHDFDSESEKKSASKTAATSSLAISLLVFLLIWIFKDPFADLVNASGFGILLVVTAAQIPLFGFSSVLTSLLQRNFHFKSLAFIKMICLVIQDAIAIVLALLHQGLWAVPIGSLCGAILQLVLLLIISKEKMLLGFSFLDFKKMFVFSGLFLTESLITWLNSSIDVFFIGSFFSLSEAGIYKNSFTTTIGLVSVFSAIYRPVLISLLAKMQDDPERFSKTLVNYQKLFAFLYIPLGVGMFCFRDTLALVFFGQGWGGAELVVGYLGGLLCLTAGSTDFLMTAFTAKGKPLYSIIADLCYTVSILCVCFLFGHSGFSTYVIARSFCVLVPGIVAVVFSIKVLNFKPKYLLINLIEPILLSFGMFGLGEGLKKYSSGFWASLCFIVLCAAFYFWQLFIFNKENFFSLLSMFISSRKRKKDS